MYNFHKIEPRINKTITNNGGNEIFSNDTESVKNNNNNNLKFRTDGFTGKFYKHSEKNYHLSFSNYHQKRKEKRTRKDHFQILSTRPESPWYQILTDVTQKSKLQGNTTEEKMQ